MRLFAFITAGAVALVLVAAACLSGDGNGESLKATPGESAERVLTGTLTLAAGNSSVPAHPDSLRVAGEVCVAVGGYSDIKEGASVTVRDENGTVIATSRLAQGSTTEYGVTNDVPCAFPFAVRDVPEASFYTIEVSRREGLTYSQEELTALGWEVAFELGD